MYHTDKLSLNEILNEISELALTPQAQSAIRNLTPKQDLHWIDDHMRQTLEMKAILHQTGSIPLNSLSSFNRAYDDLVKQAVLSAPQIDAIGDFLEDVHRLSVFMSTKADVAPTISEYASSLNNLPELRGKIRETVYKELVLDSASGKLAKIRKQMRATEDKIKTKLNQIISQADSQSLLMDSLIAMRDGRYVIPVKSQHKSKVSGRPLDFSKSGSTTFIEPEAVKQLSDKLNEYKIEEENEIYKILSALSEEIAGSERTLSVNREGIIHYDGLSAKAKYAIRINASFVKVTDDLCIDLIDARHPQLGKDAVPLNLSLGKDHKGIVITGPNTGGKTVVLKTVGLLSLMAMCGLLIPADKNTRLSVFDHILADIGDGQSITQNLSTFSSHIKNINTIIEVANSGSLVLLDEVGSGTEPNEGAGIAVAILELLFEKRSTIMATTHYSQLKAFAKDTSGFINGSMLFDSQSLNPLYQIQLGEAGKSHALLIALKLGMNPLLLDRAHRITYDQPFDQKAYSDMAHLKDTKETPQSQAKQAKPDKPADKVRKKAARTLLFSAGDSVYIPFMKTSGIVLGDPNKKGEYPVEIKGKRFSLSHKRLTPFIEQKDLYPEDYDLDIVTKSWEERKTEKKLSKGKKGAVVIHRDNQKIK
ncbi:MULTISPECIES: endonuclease MutS2 [unclassified Fusibacter]|uniref:endonuclease MutS2 n=1 Tax=unclassified Fusibacter TaxID=2624464 RepID=UPI0010130C0B|nr:MULTISPECIES: endonuclease MutS2 [unclassified Fusibacter]MCK8061230.1 hypothetical protein [Fusibacter sp. A2]NPE23426.1 endonuclease MutS2 [Fusibacter sp. A1]RXV59205.1 endonuclease MutS2 [Fusibacter sp. A1]